MIIGSRGADNCLATAKFVPNSKEFTGPASPGTSCRRSDKSDSSRQAAADLRLPSAATTGGETYMTYTTRRLLLAGAGALAVALAAAPALAQKKYEDGRQGQ
jgi:hypothetical protein